VSLLGVLGLGGIGPRLGRQVWGAVVRSDQASGRVARLPCDLHPVGAHVGDQPHGPAVQVDALIKLLGQAHGMGCAEAELAGGLLL
jgi:hypothetical protein